MRIDAHQHFWQPARGDYGWLPEDDPILSRPYLPQELAPQLAASGVERTVLVQAAPTVEETEYLLGLADATVFVGAVVGWINFEQPSHRAHLRRLARHPKLRGLRPMIQDIDDDEWMLRPDLAWAFEAMADAGLVLDALGLPQHIDNLLRLLGRHPDLTVVLDHGLKPDIAAASAEGFDRWAAGMARLAAETGAFVKLSGLVTEAAPGWTVDELQPYSDHLLAVFGTARVIWGSDWPVCRLRCEYDEWYGAARQLTAALMAVERARIFGGTAAEVYRIA